MQSVMSLQARGTILTDTGRQRTVNEDWCGALAADDQPTAAVSPSVWVVADGLSHFGTGREAARLAVETFLSAGWDSPTLDLGPLLGAAASRANQLLWDRGQHAKPEEKLYASTIVAAVLRDADAWILSAGDCRAYLLRGGGIRQLTRDHTLAAEKVRQGKLRPEEIEHHPGRHVLLRCLGHRPTVQPDLFHERLQSGDRLLLCSDGLSRHVPEPELLQIARDGDPAALCRRLIDLANQRGGTDNITVGIVEMVAAPRAAQPPASEPPASEPPASEPPASEPPASAPPAARPAGPGPAAPEASIGRLSVLQAAARRITASPELPATLQSVLDGIIEIVQAQRAGIMLRDERSGGMVFEVGRNLNAAQVASERAGIREIIARVVRAGQPALTDDPATEPRPGADLHAARQAPRAAVCLPLTVRDQCIGVIYADSPTAAGPFTRVDLDLLTTFATLSAAAIDNAKLRARLELQVRQIGAMKTSEDRILRSVSSGIIAVDRAGTITNCNRAAAEMLLIDAAGVVGKPLSTVLPLRFMLALGAPFSGGGDDPGMTIQGFDMVGELRGRGYVHFEHRLSPLKDDAGGTIGYVLALEDRTFLARLERERREAGADRERIMRIFSGMMSPDVLQEVLRIGGEGSGFGGDRRTISVMFADIRGFTGISERLAPEEVVTMLNGYLGAATDVILEHKGSIDKYIGDAVMALFGAPAPLENHALQAVRAALAMQKRFAETPAPDGRRATFGIGINTGAGIVGMIGSPNVKSYTAIGDVVNVAARLEGEARAGEILITDDTYSLVRDDVDVEGLGSIYVKGRVTPVAVHKVLGLRR